MDVADTDCSDDCDSLSKQQTGWPVQQAQYTELWRAQKAWI